jgi:hypothetical protein
MGISIYPDGFDNVVIYQGSGSTLYTFSEIVAETLENLPHLVDSFHLNLEHHSDEAKEELLNEEVNQPGLIAFFGIVDREENWTVEECKQVKEILEKVQDMPIEWELFGGSCIETSARSMGEVVDPPEMLLITKSNKALWFPAYLERFIDGLQFCVDKNVGAYFC